MVLVETVDIAKIIKIGSLHASRKLSFCDLFYQIFKVHDESYNIEQHRATRMFCMQLDHFLISERDRGF